MKRSRATTTFDGIGASLGGGRWNSIGTRIVYLAESQALAALEIIIHIPRHLLKEPYAVIPAYFDKHLLQTINPLPTGWDKPKPVSASQAEGDKWALSQATPILKAPSIIIRDSFNYLLNPQHPDISLIQFGEAKPFVFDPRLH